MDSDYDGLPQDYLKLDRTALLAELEKTRYETLDVPSQTIHVPPI